MAIELQTACSLPIQTIQSTKRNGDSSAQSRRISSELAKRIGRRKFDMWFANTTLHVHGERLELATDSQFVANWIDSHFTDDLRGVAEQMLGRSMTIDIQVAASEQACEKSPNQRHAKNESSDQQAIDHDDGEQSQRRTATEAPNSFQRQDEQQRHNGQADRGNLHRRSSRGGNGTLRGQSLRRLEDFIVGSCNKLAFATAIRLAQDADPRCISPLFIHGDCGVGKTHLLQGICQRFIDINGRSQHVRYVTGEQFTNEYIAAIRANNIDSFRQRIRKLDLLAIDDVHFLSNKVRTQTEFLYTLDAIDLSGARVVLASDNHPHHIKKFSQSLVSRFLSGMVVKVDRPDRATRIDLIHRLAAARGLRINEPAVELIATNCIGSVRELEGALTKLAAYHEITERGAPHQAFGISANGSTSAMANPHPQSRMPNGANAVNGSHGEIGLVLVEQIFRDQAWPSGGSNGAQVVRIATVIDAVSERMAVSKADMMGSGRHRRIVIARALVVYLAREMTTHSFPEIAQALGRANHSTVHTADQRFRKQIVNQETLELMTDGGQAVSLKELADQLRREVMERGIKRQQ